MQFSWIPADYLIETQVSTLKFLAVIFQTSLNMPFHNTWDVVESLQLMKCHQITCKSFNNRNCFQEFYFVSADVLCVLQSVTVHCRCLAIYAMSYAPWRIWGLNPRREKRFLCFSECPACYSFSTRSSFWRYATLNVWSWPITISSAKVQICIHSSWLGAFSYRIHAAFSSWFCVLSHTVYTPCKVCFVFASHWLLFASCARKM